MLMCTTIAQFTYQYLVTYSSLVSTINQLFAMIFYNFWTVLVKIGHCAQQNDRNVESVYPSGLSQIPAYSSSVVCYFAYLLVSGVFS